MKIDPQGPLGLWIFLILCVIGISLDPLFFYIPVINDDQKCLKFDKKLGTTAIILRSVFDFFHIICIISRLDNDFFAPFYKLYRQVNLHKDACTVARKYLLRFFLLCLKNMRPDVRFFQPTKVRLLEQPLPASVRTVGARQASQELWCFHVSNPCSKSHKSLWKVGNVI
ncbi:hypothetical protein Pint_25244 [Pistacia integerrima]|uniref:Uncharacterized protein n=1 Tax=Pistacia integerrima TaxID=434235 RepID=A0ACC0YBF0_9ROSI|nr:hypothetical protein Pint_25244 [Pistacia integerrima]